MLITWNESRSNGQLEEDASHPKLMEYVILPYQLTASDFTGVHPNFYKERQYNMMFAMFLLTQRKSLARSINNIPL
jgi:hypothetical protein